MRRFWAGRARSPDSARAVPKRVGVVPHTRHHGLRISGHLCPVASLFCSCTTVRGWRGGANLVGLGLCAIPVSGGAEHYDLKRCCISVHPQAVARGDSCRRRRAVSLPLLSVSRLQRTYPLRSSGRVPLKPTSSTWWSWYALAERSQSCRLRAPTLSAIATGWKFGIIEYRRFIGLDIFCISLKVCIYTLSLRSHVLPLDIVFTVFARSGSAKIRWYDTC